DRHHPFVAGDEARQGIEKRGLTATGAAADENVEARLDARFHQHRHFRREGLVVEKVFELQGVGPEAANAEAWAVEGDRWNDGIDAGAVWQAGVHHRAGFIDAPADFRYDAVDDLQQVIVVAEFDLGLLQFAAALNVHLERAVDENIADGRIFEKDFEWAEAERFVEHFLDELLALDAVEQRVFRIAKVLDDAADVAAHGVRREIADAGEVEALDEFGVNLSLEFVEVLAAARAADGAGAGEARDAAGAAAVVIEAIEFRDALL